MQFEEKVSSVDKEEKNERKEESVSPSSTPDLSSSAEHKKYQRPKSVSFHSASSLPAERKISSALDCLKYMINGSSLIKVRPSSRQYRRFFTLEEDLSSIRWIPSTKKSNKARLPIRCMREVRMGKSTEVLRSREIAGSYSEDCAFSVIYNDTFESLDLIAPSADEANIWVTGLNVLIGASKSPDTLDERQRMREKWLKEMFDKADTKQKGLLDEWETISLMKKLNNQLSTVRLRQKIMEYEHGKIGEERGRIGSSDFVNLFKETSTRPEIYYLLVRFSGKDYMTLDDFQLFLEGEQGMYNVSQEYCEKIIQQFEHSMEAQKNRQFLIDGFTQFLLSETCDMTPDKLTIDQDMSHPLSHYFISTSHNTYLLQDQLKGPSSIEGYVNVLQKGCRCIKVDCWDDIQGPVVYHGNTLTSKIPLADVLQTISDNAFVTSQYPLILHLENHCCLESQREISSLISFMLSKYLYVPERDGHLLLTQTSPERLKRKIIIMGKKLPEYCKGDGEVTDEEDISDSSKVNRKIKLAHELSDLVTLKKTRFLDYEISEEIQKTSDASSFAEILATKLCQAFAEDLVNHNKQYLTHVFPSSNRVDSSNFNPLHYWSYGCQMVAMNFQTSGQMMDLYEGWFQPNGNCGYILKPHFLRDHMFLFSPTAKEPYPGVEPITFHLKIISAQQLPQPEGSSCKASAIDPYIVVQVHGVPADCAEARTRTISNEGHSPIFDESFEFIVTVPEIAILRLAVLDDDCLGDDFIGQYAVPLSNVQTGYRHVHLKSSTGCILQNTTIFIHSSVTRRSESLKLYKKKPSISLRQVGIKSIDDHFKNAASLLSDAQRLRTDHEQAMVDLCKECALPDSGNIVQCLRVLSLRTACCHNISNIQVMLDKGFPYLKVFGELPTTLNKAFVLLEKVLMEFKHVIESADNLLTMMSHIFTAGITLQQELPNLCSSNGIKGKKVEKVYENLFWNMTLLCVHIDNLRATTEESSRAIQQVKNLGVVLNRIFQKEKENINTASSENKASTSTILSSQLLPPVQQVPLTPTSPCDGRLRGILKKTYSSPITPSTSSRDKIENFSYHNPLADER